MQSCLDSPRHAAEKVRLYQRSCFIPRDLPRGNTAADRSHLGVGNLVTGGSESRVREAHPALNFSFIDMRDTSGNRYFGCESAGRNLAGQLAQGGVDNLVAGCPESRIREAHPTLNVGLEDSEGWTVVIVSHGSSNRITPSLSDWSKTIA